MKVRNLTSVLAISLTIVLAACGGDRSSSGRAVTPSDAAVIKAIQLPTDVSPFV
jgi:hypothetical protein